MYLRYLKLNRFRSTTTKYSSVIGRQHVDFCLTVESGKDVVARKTTDPACSILAGTRMQPHAEA